RDHTAGSFTHVPGRRPLVDKTDGATLQAGAKAFLYKLVTGQQPQQAAQVRAGSTCPGRARRQAAADWIFRLFSALCLQRPSHSFFLFGQHMAIAQRLLFLYASWSVASVAYLRLRDRIRALDVRLLVLLSAPIVLDGLRGLWGFGSAWLPRTWTATVFAVAAVWFIYPRLDWPQGLAGRHFRGAQLGPLRPVGSIFTYALESRGPECAW
ncbi:MAG TPA: DUF2085 domain-containing protein, partial [Chloroflexota bacterium]